MSKANPVMKAAKKPQGIYNTLLKVRCPVCGTKRTIMDGKDLGCPNKCEEAKTKVVEPSEKDSEKPAEKKPATKKSPTKENK